MAWSFNTPTNNAKTTTASHSQTNPEEMEKYTWYCPQYKQDHTTTTTTNKDKSAKQSSDDHHRHQLKHFLLDKYNFQESDHGKPWYQQSLRHPVLENEKAKIYWNVPFILEKPPENGANKPAVIVHDKETNIWGPFLESPNTFRVT